MSPTLNAEPDGDAYTCGTLLMCLCLPGFSKNKPAEGGAGRQPAAEQDQPTEQEEPTRLPSRASSMEKLERPSLHSGSIGFEFLVVPDEGDERGARVIQGYCPSPCFDLPVELIRAGERCSIVASDTPVTDAFVFEGYQRGAMKKVASCLASGVGGNGARPTHLVRFLSATGSGVPVRRPVISSGGTQQGMEADGDGKFDVVPATSYNGEPQMVQGMRPSFQV